MSPASIEERVREYVAAERNEIRVPPLLTHRILHTVQLSEPAPRRPQLGPLRAAAAMAAILLLGLGIASIRMSQGPAGLVQGTWSSASNMLIARSSHTATLLPNGKVLVVGGSHLVSAQASRPLASAELYDPTSRKWSSAGSLSAPRWGHTATLLPNGKVLVAGGDQGDGITADSLSSVELYDPQTNTWSAAASLHTPRSSHSATLLPDGRVLVVGGFQSLSTGPTVSRTEFGTTLASSELYDPASDTWVAGPAMSTPRAKHVAVLLADHRVLLIGGTALSKAASAWRTAELYDPASQSWSSTADMQYSRAFPSASLLPDGRVLVVGDVGVNYRTAELFDPTMGQWSPAPKPAVGRAEAAAAQLRDGNVLVAGGVGEQSAQVFEWRRNAWSSAGDMAMLRAGASATVLANGEVLVAGGFGRLSAPWASAEVYDPNGPHVVASPRSTSADSPLGGIAPIVAAAALLLGLGFWYARRRKALLPGRGDLWIDSEV